jgi:hypothetical protein
MSLDVTGKSQVVEADVAVGYIWMLVLPEHIQGRASVCTPHPEGQ